MADPKIGKEGFLGQFGYAGPNVRSGFGTFEWPANLVHGKPTVVVGNSILSGMELPKLTSFQLVSIGPDRRAVRDILVSQAGVFASVIDVMLDNLPALIPIVMGNPAARALKEALEQVGARVEFASDLATTEAALDLSRIVVGRDFSILGSPISASKQQEPISEKAEMEEAANFQEAVLAYVEKTLGDPEIHLKRLRAKLKEI